MIHRVRIQNFKSIVDVTVALSEVTVLVGKSGTGKSNFIQSLQSLRRVLTSQLQLQLLQQQWPQLRPAMAPEGPLTFDIEFSIPGIDDRFAYKLSIGQHQQGPMDERLTLGDKCLFHQAIAKQNPQPTWRVEPATVPAVQPGLIALGRIPSISDVVIAFTALTSGLGCYNFSDNVLMSAPRQPTDMMGLQPQSIGGLDDEGRNYLFAIKEILSNLQDLKVRKSIVAALQQINPSVSSAELDSLQQPQRVVVGHKFNGKTLSLDLAQESAGFRRFYAHLLALYQRPPKQTLMFEHPEDGIHPGALSLLAEEFKAAPRQGRGQVILTTHNPKLLDHFDAEQIRVVELDEFKTRIGLVSQEQKEAIQDKLLDAGELLTVDPARMQTEATAS